MKIDRIEELVLEAFLIKGKVQKYIIKYNQKYNFCHYLFTRMLSQTCIIFSFAEHKRRYFEECYWSNLRRSIWWYKNKTLWQNWLTDDKICIFGWTILLILMKQQNTEKIMNKYLYI